MMRGERWEGVERDFVELYGSWKVTTEVILKKTGKVLAQLWKEYSEESVALVKES